MRGETDAPEDPLFKKFKKVFGSINVSRRSSWDWPNDPNDWRYTRASDVLEWACKHMSIATWPREDYRELIELVSIFLGGIVKRVHGGVPVVIEPSIRKPGVIHRARFMSSCLYLLKIYLYCDQFQFLTDPEKIEHVKILAEYVALVHAPYFLQSPLAVSAPRQDRDFWVDIHNYQKCYKEGDVQYDMLEAVLCIMQLNHLWYLTQELVIFALFDNNLGDDERKSMAHNLLSTPRPRRFKPGEIKLMSIQSVVFGQFKLLIEYCRGWCRALPNRYHLCRSNVVLQLMKKVKAF